MNRGVTLLRHSDFGGDLETALEKAIQIVFHRGFYVFAHSGFVSPLKDDCIHRCKP